MEGGGLGEWRASDLHLRQTEFSNTSELGREPQTSDETTAPSTLSSAWQDSGQKTRVTQAQAGS